MLAPATAVLALALTQSFPAWVDRYWQLPVPTSDAPACDGCHAAEARWQARSIHARAASPGVLGQLPTEGPHRAVGLACLFCHAPEDVQQAWRTTQAPPAPSKASSPPSRWTAALGDGSPIEGNPRFREESLHRGVSCSACHWRDGAVVTSPDHLISEAAQRAHPVRAEGLLLQPAFCGNCHQFGADVAVNGKPVENTWVEMQQSFWGRAGATCQGCHLPSGEHRFQGIHSADLVSASVSVALEVAPGSAKGELVLTNEAVGHDFPTYVTPRVHLLVEALDSQGRFLARSAELWIGRDLRFEGGAWHELEDTRVPPGQRARLAFDLGGPRVARLRARVRVEPDYGYVDLYRGLLQDSGMKGERRDDLQAALSRALGSGYDLFDEVRPVRRR